MDSPGSASNSRKFKRSYVACVSCRARKSRCIIQDKPPCSKCRREHRECQFNHRPRAPKHRDPPKWTKATQSATDETAAEVPSSQQWDTNGLEFLSTSPQDLTGASDEYSQDQTPSKSPPNHLHSLYSRVRSTVITGSNDALDILSDAAHPQYSLNSSATCDAQPAQTNRAKTNSPKVTPGGFSGSGFTITALSEPDDATLDLWDKCRFVRQGWFTAQEAVTYIDLFFEKLSTLSPIVVDQFRPHAAHVRLVQEEAMLCCTLLMVASRFFMLPGAGGTSRSHYVHQRLWSHCEVLIRRILLGQEKTSTSRTRAVGTVESLMLISDWHPRAIHLPPETDGWDGLLISPEYNPINRKSKNDEEPFIRWREDVFEPAKRANRMSWMLLGVATSLANELNIFSNHKRQFPNVPCPEELRNFRAQKLLYVYVTETATRLGYPSVIPESSSVMASHCLLQDTSDPEQRSWLAYMSMNMELAQLSRAASSMFFQSTEHLQDLVLSGRYADLLDHFSISLSKWQEKLESLSRDIKQSIRNGLLIEFHHLKACTGAISIQAAVSRAASSGLGAAARSEEALSVFITSRDAKFFQDLISDSRSVLQIATLSEFKEQLPFAPARVKICVISASVFMLKALSVGSANVNVHDAFSILDQCTAMLKSCPPDDMDFALRYATLIEKHAAHLRAHLTSARGQASVDESGQVLFSGHVGAGLDKSVTLSTFNATLQGEGSANSVDLDMLAMGNADTWTALPFNSNIAPFNSGCDQLSLGLDVDSLNFLWSLPDIS